MRLILLKIARCMSKREARNFPFKIPGENGKTPKRGKMMNGLVHMQLASDVIGARSRLFVVSTSLKAYVALSVHSTASEEGVPLITTLQNVKCL